MKTLSPWPPTILLAVGALLATVGVKSQRSQQLRVPLTAAIPTAMEGYSGRPRTLSQQEIDVVGVDSYSLQVFNRADTTQPGPSNFSLYIGYYERQTSGRTIHSPKNCLPGGGWEPLTSGVATVTTPGGPVTVNRYLIQNGRRQALVLYWYQGRGRVASNEYRVKWDLVRDAALKRHSEEALVRIVVEIRGNENDAFALASRVASTVVPSLDTALPAG
jgi:EpsI family protein